MPMCNKGGASNAWLEREPDYAPPQQVEEVTQSAETGQNAVLGTQVRQSRKRASRADKVTT